jgi:hypothetical protein
VELEEESWVDGLDVIEEPDDTIQIGLRHEAQAYSAISYTWGSQPLSVEIECNECILLIKQNLAEALRYVRSRERSCLVWADALCINQKDDEEKGCQVSLMSHIYEHASCVEVYLGQDSQDGDAERAFGLLEELYQISQNIPPERLKVLMLLSPELQELRIPPKNDPAYQSLQRLIEKPWFSRAWVVQEITVARRVTVHCGRSTIPWKALIYGVRLAEATGSISMAKTHRFKMLCGTRVEFHRGSFAIDLMDLLEDHRSVEATDLRDKVYAFLGISRRVNRKEINLEPDYSLTTAEVYTRMTASALAMQNTLDALSFTVSRDRRNRDASLPSWVVDWTEHDNVGGDKDPCVKLLAIKCFDAAQTRTCPKYCVVDGRMLELSGIIFDEISEVGDLLNPVPTDNLPPTEGDSESIYRLQMDCLRRMCSVQYGWKKVSRCRLGKAYVNGEDGYDAFLRTVILNQIPLRCPIKDVRELGLRMIMCHLLIQVFSYLHSILRRCFLWRLLSHVGLRLLQYQARRISTDTDAELLARWHSASVGRRLIRTRNGYIGMAGALTMKGDHIALVKGGRIPLVLRRTGEKWIFVSDSYVHGIMQGEAFYEGRCKRIILE